MLNITTAASLKRRVSIIIASFSIALLTLAAAPAQAADQPQASAQSDPQFSSLFAAWVRMDGGSPDAMPTTKSSIPSRQPITDIRSISSPFGERHDPFNGHSRMHDGVDLPGALGTPVYATADGVVERAGWTRGYGNLVEINHGHGLETRYGHLSKLIASPDERVHRGQLIGLMGSTGRSTGSHLHYEVRIAGTAVNPMPYIDDTNYEVALADAKAHREQLAMGGPEARSATDGSDD